MLPNQIPPFERIAEDLQKKGWSWVSDLFPRTLLEDLRREVLEQDQKGRFREAKVGKGEKAKRRPEIRSDWIRWIERTEAPPATLETLEVIDSLRKYLNQALLLGLSGYEAHFTTYPKGAFYQKHIDQFQGDPNRIVSFILYLNPEWREGWGGQLRIYNPRSPDEVLTEISPLLGSFAVFLSEEVPHEVLKTLKTRYSLTGWMRRDLSVLK